MERTPGRASTVGKTTFREAAAAHLLGILCLLLPFGPRVAGFDQRFWWQPIVVFGLTAVLLLISSQWKQKEVARSLRNRGGILAVLFGAAALLSVARLPEQAPRPALAYFTLCLLFLIFGGPLIRGHRLVIYRYLVFSGLLTGLRTLSLQGERMEMLAEQHWNLGNPGYVALFLAAPLLIAIGLVFEERRFRVFYLCAALLCAGAIVRTETITVVFCVAAALILFILLRRGKKRTLIPLFAALLLAGVAIGFSPLGERLETKTRQMQKGDYSRLLNHRTQGMEAAWRMIRENPLLGVGYGRFADHYVPVKIELIREGRTFLLEDHFLHAHHEALHWIAETGVIGGLCLLAALWLVGRSLHSRAWPPLETSLVVMAAIQCQMWFPFHIPAVHLPLLLILAGVLGPKIEREEKRAPAPLALRGTWMLGLIVFAGFYGSGLLQDRQAQILTWEATRGWEENLQALPKNLRARQMLEKAWELDHSSPRLASKLGTVECRLTQGRKGKEKLRHAAYVTPRRRADYVLLYDCLSRFREAEESEEMEALDGVLETLGIGQSRVRKEEKMRGVDTEVTENRRLDTPG